MVDTSTGQLPLLPDDQKQRQLWQPKLDNVYYFGSQLDEALLKQINMASTSSTSHASTPTCSASHNQQFATPTTEYSCSDETPKATTTEQSGDRLPQVEDHPVRATLLKMASELYSCSLDQDLLAIPDKVVSGTSRTAGICCSSCRNSPASAETGSKCSLEEDKMGCVLEPFTLLDETKRQKAPSCMHRRHQGAPSAAERRLRLLLTVWHRLLSPPLPYEVQEIYDTLQSDRASCGPAHKRQKLDDDNIESNSDDDDSDEDDYSYDLPGEYGEREQNTVDLAIHLLRRLISALGPCVLTHHSAHITRLSLATCLWDATKIEGLQGRQPSVEELEIATCVPRRFLLHGEARLLRALGWNLVKGWVRHILPSSS